MLNFLCETCGEHLGFFIKLDLFRLKQDFCIQLDCISKTINHTLIDILFYKQRFEFQISNIFYSFLLATAVQKNQNKYRISANSFRGNYTFLNLALCGNYSREEIIQERKLFADIWYSKFDTSKLMSYQGQNIFTEK
jgi:hypothetical protein